MHNFKIVCHRGASKSAPENTLASLEKAIDLGAYAVEFDIRTSRDGVLYVIHDKMIDRTTNGRGYFADMMSDEIDQLDAGSWFAPEFTGQQVPRLETFLDACAGRIATYAEIKQADPARVRDMLSERGLLQSAWTFSFDEDIRAATRAKVPDFRRMVLFEHVGEVANAVALGASILEFHADTMTAERVRQAREAGLITQLFYGGSEPEVFEAALGYGIEQFNIDDVDTLRAAAEAGVANSGAA